MCPPAHTRAALTHRAHLLWRLLPAQTLRLFFSMERGMGEYLSNGGDSWSCDGEISRACACAKIVFKLHACTHPHKRTHWHRELGQGLSLAGRAYWFRSAYLKPPNTTEL